jgi:hypothetical protein
VHRFRQVLLGQAEIFTTPLRHVETAQELRAALQVMITDAQTPERDEGRILRIESISFAHHNMTASAGIAAAKQETSLQIMEIVQPLYEKKFLADGMSGVAFARIWYALFFGQIALEGEHALSINQESFARRSEILAGNRPMSSWSNREVPALTPRIASLHPAGERGGVLSIDNNYSSSSTGR